MSKAGQTQVDRSVLVPESWLIITIFVYSFYLDADNNVRPRLE